MSNYRTQITRFWGLDLFVVLFLSLLALASDQKQPMIGESSPPFALKSLDGKGVSLAEHRGKFVVLHFAASW